MLPLTQTNPSSQPGAPSSSTTVAAANTDNTINYPTRAPPGAPGRSYLNTHLAPYQRTGMSKILDVKYRSLSLNFPPSLFKTLAPWNIF